MSLRPSMVTVTPFWPSAEIELPLTEMPGRDERASNSVPSLPASVAEGLKDTFSGVTMAWGRRALTTISSSCWAEMESGIVSVGVGRLSGDWGSARSRSGMRVQNMNMRLMGWGFLTQN